MVTPNTKLNMDEKIAAYLMKDMRTGPFDANAKIKQLIITIAISVNSA